jgi:hypothetical protein
LFSAKKIKLHLHGREQISLLQDSIFISKSSPDFEGEKKRSQIAIFRHQFTDCRQNEAGFPNFLLLTSLMTCGQIPNLAKELLWMVANPLTSQNWKKHLL